MTTYGTEPASPSSMTPSRLPVRASSTPFGLALRTWTVLAVVVGTGAVAGCGIATSDAATAGPPEAADTTSSSSGGASLDPGKASTGTPIKPETILVHASPDLPAMRLCLSANDEEPIPSDNIMPRTNQVGVDVGGAAKLGAINTKIVAGQTAYLFRASVTERRDAAGTPQRHQSCQSYKNGAEANIDYWEVQMPPVAPNALLVIRGCRSTAVCADKPSLKSVALTSISAPKPESISAAFVSLSPDLVGTAFSVDLKRSGVSSSLVSPGTLALDELTPAKEFAWSALSSTEIAQTSAVVGRQGTTVLERDFTNMASIIDLNSDPTKFYAASRFVFVAVGWNEPKDTHPQRGLHLLALPLDNAVVTPEDPREDGGAVLPPPVDAGKVDSGT